MQHSPSPDPEPTNGQTTLPEGAKRGVKRLKVQDDTDDPPGANTSSSAFRNVSACNRCRSRKNRCDQNLPACSACEKVGVDCVGYDPLTKRTVPRSFVYYLETRTTYLESLLRDNGIRFAAADQFTLQTPGLGKASTPRGDGNIAGRLPSLGPPGAPLSDLTGSRLHDKNENVEAEKLDKLVTNIGMSAQGTPSPWHLGSAGFGRVLYAAVKSTVTKLATERGGGRSGKLASSGPPASMRDSFFGLQTKPTIREAHLPDRDLGMKLVELYFNHANPQIPILHRLEFMALFERVYGLQGHQPSPRELYMLNMVFAIGAAIIFGSGIKDERPEEYHAAAIVHLEGFLGGTSTGLHIEGSGGGLEDLQAVLLLAGFALLRPVAPGLWYIVGVAIRLATDLGLHYEDGVAIGEEDLLGGPSRQGVDLKQRQVGEKEQGRRQWIRDLRRRLWWCTYAFDRMVSSCVGRPFGITDQVITTEFPSLLDDAFISPAGVKPPMDGSNPPSYKHVSHHYFRLRLLQSEIIQVLQYQQAQKSQNSKSIAFDTFLHTNLPSPFLAKFNSFRQWRVDIDRRLWLWKESSPTQLDTGVQFSPLFLELNYWQAVILLYRQSLAVPFALAEELAQVNDEVSSPSAVHIEERGDEEYVYLKIAEAAQQVLKIYRQLHRVHLVNYVYLSTHHIFQAGVSLLYALWNSTAVRSHFSLDDVDFTVLAATSVLGDLATKCPPAEICKTAYTRMAQATIQMCLSSTGFGDQAARNTPTTHSSVSRDTFQETRLSTIYPQRSPRDRGAQPMISRPQVRAPRFDMNLEALFSPDESRARPFGHLQRAYTSPSVYNQALSPGSQSSNSVNPQLHNTHLHPQISPRTPHQAPLLRDLNSQTTRNSFAQIANPVSTDMGNMNDMSFLDTFPTGSATGSATSDINNFDFDFLSMGGNDFTTNHDWAEGSGMDLMDGFFFGGPGNGAGPG